MILAWLAIALVAAPPAARLACPGLTAFQIADQERDFYLQYFSQQLEQHGVRMTTQAEIGALLGLERQKQLLGCSEESTQCFAELAGALGVDGVLVGNVAKVGAGYGVTLKVLKTDGTTLVSDSARPDSQDALLDWLSETAARFASAVVGPAAVESSLPGKRTRVLPWISGAVGLGALIAGGVSLGFSYSNLQRIEMNSPPITSATELSGVSSNGRNLYGASIALLAIGAVALAVAIVLFVTGVGP